MVRSNAKNYEANAKAQYALTQALNEDDFSRIINCKFAYEAVSYTHLTLPTIYSV